MAGPYEINAPKDIAMQYGGNKVKIAQAAQMGLIDPTSAVLAGMFIDKMRTAQIEESAPQQSVAQEVMAPAMAAPQMGVPSGPPQEAGIASLPVPDEMFTAADGGIVAFANGGVTLSDVMRRATMEEQREYQRTGRLPARLQAMLSGETPLAAPPSGAGGRATELFSDAPAADPTAMGLTPSGGLTQFYPGLPALTQSPNVAPSAPGPSPDVEAILAQAERGEGPNVERPTSINRTPQGVAPQNNVFTPPAVSKDKVDTGKATGEKGLSGFEEYQKMLRDAGISADPYAEDRAMIEQRRRDLEKTESEDKNIAMIMAGLTGMNTKNLAEFAQKAGTAGFGYYGQARKEARAERRELDKMASDTRKAEQALKRGDIEKYMDFKDKAEQRRIQMQGVEAQRMAAAKQAGLVEYTDRYAKAKGISFDEAARELEALKVQNKGPLAFLSQLQGAGVDVNELIKKYPGLQPTR